MGMYDSYNEHQPLLLCGRKSRVPVPHLEQYVISMAISPCVIKEDSNYISGPVAPLIKANGRRSILLK